MTACRLYSLHRVFIRFCLSEYGTYRTAHSCAAVSYTHLETTKESETFCSLTAAKKWMRERIKQKHEVSGQKYRVYSDGEFVNCGSISLTGSHKSFVANTRPTKKGY